MSGKRFRLDWAMLAPAVALVAAPMPAKAEGLADAIAAAYAANPQLQSQRAGTRAVDERLTQARAAYGPVVTAQASRAYAYEKAEIGQGRDDTASGTTNTFTGTVSQPIFTSGRLSGNLRVARAGIDVARESLRLVEADVLSNVIGAYVSVLRDQRLMVIAQENLDLLTRQRGDTGARLRGREATATDYAQTEVRYQIALARLKESSAALETSRGQYLLHVGHLPVNLAPLPTLAGLPATIEQAYATADENNGRLLAAMAQERASRAAIGAARAEFGPVVALEATGGRGALTQFSSSRRDFFTGGITATLPVFNSGLTSSRVREAQQRNDQDWFLIDQTRREIRQLIAQSWDRMVATRGTIVDYTAAVDRAEAAFAGAREQERAGVRTTLDVLDQARDLLDARTALAQAEASEYLNRTALLSGMGMLEAARLIGGVDPYDPAVNLRRVRGVLVPPFQPVLQAVDAVVQAPVRDRPTRDAATTQKPGLVLPPIATTP